MGGADAGGRARLEPDVEYPGRGVVERPLYSTGPVTERADPDGRAFRATVNSLPLHPMHDYNVVVGRGDHDEGADRASVVAAWGPSSPRFSVIGASDDPSGVRVHPRVTAAASGGSDRLWLQRVTFESGAESNGSERWAACVFRSPRGDARPAVGGSPSGAVFDGAAVEAGGRFGVSFDPGVSWSMFTGGEISADAAAFDATPGSFVVVDGSVEVDAPSLFGGEHAPDADHELREGPNAFLAGRRVPAWAPGDGGPGGDGDDNGDGNSGTAADGEGGG